MTLKKILSIIGLNINLKKELKTIIITDILSFLFIFLIIIVRFSLSTTYSSLMPELIKKISLFDTICYGCFCLLQEILARGILQRFLKSKNNNSILSILIVTIIFTILHFNYDIITIIGAIVISIVSGIFTDKKDNILIGFLFHWIVGGLGYIFLSYTF